MKLYRCEPLSAWITPEACKHNAELAEAGKRAGQGTWDYVNALRVVDHCPGCPGVLERSKVDGFAPRPVAGTTRKAPRKKARRGPRRKKIRVPAGTAEAVTRHEAAQMLGVSESGAAYALRTAGIKPCARAGPGPTARTVYTKQAVLELRRERDVRSEKKPASASASASSDDALQRVTHEAGSDRVT